MGLLVDGKWVDKWYDTKKSKGRFERSKAQFRNWVTADGSAGPTGVAGFKAESGRYHLYVSHACPWANRTMIFRGLKNLVPHITVSVVNWIMKENGWTFNEGPGVTGDNLYDHKFLHEVYTHADPEYSGRVTVPVLWDKKQETIVSNESADIIRMLNSAFNGLEGVPSTDFYPEALRDDIHSVNDRVYDEINNGVYKAGFATTQEAYEEAVVPLFKALDDLEKLLDCQRYLVSDTVATEADWRLFTTLVRFDPVYNSHFKCNIRRIEDYPNISAYVRELYQVDGVADTIHMDHIKGHYFMSHTMINPTGVVPLGTGQDLTAPHDRSTHEYAKHTTTQDFVAGKSG